MTKAPDGGGDGAADLLRHAMDLHRGGNLQRAVGCYERFLQSNPTHAEALFLAGSAHAQLGRQDVAESLLRRAVEAAPDRAEILNNLGSVLSRQGRTAAAHEVFEQAVALSPDFAPAHNNLGSCLVTAGRNGAAIAAFRRAVDIDPSFATARNNLGAALRDAGEPGEAESCFRQALADEPAHGDAHSNLCVLLLRRSDGAGALAACDAYLSVFPGHSGALAFKSVALRQLGRQAEADDLVDLDRLVHTETLSVPDGYPDLKTFNRALADQVAAHPTLVRNPRNQATRLGLRSGDLAGQGGGPLRAFEDIARGAVGRYLAAVSGRPGHPFDSAAVGSPARLEMWAVILERGGHLVPHVHRESWISGVYYPEVPASVAAESGGRGGWIGYGRPPPEYRLDSPAPVRWLRPREGLMILMPSYVFHETTPVVGDDRRVSLAFDAFRSAG